MTREHRIADITVQVLNKTSQELIASLASTIEERDTLKARVAELEQQLSPSPAAQDGP